MDCYIFDIDGTLANGDHRLHHIQKEPKDWDAYFLACEADTPHSHIITLARDLLVAGKKLVFVSGRSDLVKIETVFWLENQIACDRVEARLNEGCKLYMRQQGDHRPDDIVKIELLAKIRDDGYVPIMAFDDRDRVVAAWRAAGIPCAQVAPGDF